MYIYVCEGMYACVVVVVVVKAVPSGVVAHMWSVHIYMVLIVKCCIYSPLCVTSVLCHRFGAVMWTAGAAPGVRIAPRDGDKYKREWNGDSDSMRKK